MSYELVQVQSDPDWARYHQIREEELFKGRTGRTYNPNHPDEHAPDNVPLLLKLDGVGIGTTRLDLQSEQRTAIVRLVAITKSKQGKGHGKVLEQMVEDFARSRGIQKLLTNAAPTAQGFYEKTGFVCESWDPEELTGIAQDCVQMSKTL